MAIPFHKAVSSLEAIASSIDTDEQVFRWFNFLVTRPAISEHLTDVNHAATLYPRLRKILCLQLLLNVLIVGLLVLIIVSKQYVYLWAGLLFIYPLFKLNQNQKKLVVEISTELLKKDFQLEDLCQKTLYQLCEIYSKKYNIPSLVDTIYHLDNISRKTIMCVFIFTCFIYPLKVWQIFATTIASYFVIQIILKIPFIYKNLK